MCAFAACIVIGPMLHARTQDGFQQLLSDHRFNRALAALRLLVRHHLPLLVKQLGAWRQTTHANLQRMPEKTERDRMVVFTKRVRARSSRMQRCLLHAPPCGHWRMYVCMGTDAVAHGPRVSAALRGLVRPAGGQGTCGVQ